MGFLTWAFIALLCWSFYWLGWHYGQESLKKKLRDILEWNA